MEAKEVFEAVLQLSAPWEVASVTREEETKRFIVELAYPKRTFGKCPECGAECKVHDRLEPREVRHLDCCEWQTYIRFSLPRTVCPKHGTLAMHTPFCLPGSRFSLAFEEHATQVLHASKNRLATAILLGISWDQADGLLSRAAARAEAQRKADEVVRHMGVDEKAFLRGHDSFVSILYDADTGRAIEVVEGKSQKTAIGLVKHLTKAQRLGVESVSMDFAPCFRNFALKKFPLADIVHDPFHIVQNALKALDSVRRRENGRLLKEKRRDLVGLRYALGKNPENLTEKQKAALAALDLEQYETGLAYRLKEELRALWKCPDEEAAYAWLTEWLRKATESGLAPFGKLAKSIAKRMDGVLAWFRHKVTNARAEGTNGLIQLAKATARGFRNFENYRRAILFFCGGTGISIPRPRFA
jgi:transposase